jgi:hypothetical protein
MAGLIGRASTASALLLILAGCESHKTVTAQNATTAEVAQKVKDSGIADGGFVSPGRWQMTMTVNSMSMPGLPPEVAKRMQDSTGKPHAFEHCVTEEEAKKPKEDFFAGNEAKSCRYDSFNLGGGKIDMVMHCDAPGGSKQVMKMNGTYSADAYRMTIASNVEGQAGSPVKGMTLNATVDARRLGVCTGKEKG